MSKICSKCGNFNNDNETFCVNCGTRLEIQSRFKTAETQPVNDNIVSYSGKSGENSQSGGQAPKKNKILLISVIVLAVLLVAAIALIVITNVINKDGTPQTTVLTVEEIEETTEIEETEAEEPSEKETEVPSTKAPTTQPAQDKLYHPADKYYTSPYKAYCYCTDTDVQDYVKMRYGPSKYDYDVVTKLDNNTLITVESKSVDGWTLCDADGTEGWIRSDFIFDSPRKSSLPSYEVEDDKLYRPSSAYYYDTPWLGYCYCTDTAVQDYVKMRYGPGKYDYDVVAILDNYTKIRVETESVNGWTLCNADGIEGWIRSDFIFHFEA